MEEGEFARDRRTRCPFGHDILHVGEAPRKLLTGLTRGRTERTKSGEGVQYLDT